MIYDREEAADRAELATENVPGMCQQWTRNIYGAPSAGDQDRDGDADAVDGWASEPVSARHPGDRNPPRGVPVAWGGHHGHRAVSLGAGKIRSTDAGGTGKVATVDLGWVERTWGLTYLGWSDTITGIPIPLPPPPPPKTTRGEHVDAALRQLRRADRTGTRGKYIERAVKVLERIKPWRQT